MSVNSLAAQKSRPLPRDSMGAPRCLPSETRGQNGFVSNKADWDTSQFQGTNSHQQHNRNTCPLLFATCRHSGSVTVSPTQPGTENRTARGNYVAAPLYSLQNSQVYIWRTADTHTLEETSIWLSCAAGDNS